jgi:hypothetical protein
MEGGMLDRFDQGRTSEGSAQHQERCFKHYSADRYCHSRHHQPHSYSCNFHHLLDPLRLYPVSPEPSFCVSFPMIGLAEMVFSSIEDKFENNYCLVVSRRAALLAPRLSGGFKVLQRYRL